MFISIVLTDEATLRGDGASNWRRKGARHSDGGWHIKDESRWSQERLGTWDRVVSTIVCLCLCFRTQERMKESQLRNEMREEIAQKDLLLTQLQTRAKELQETLSRVQENETTSKHDVALLLKEKVQWFYRLYITSIEENYSEIVIIIS